MKVGDLVRETEQDDEFVMFPGEFGVIVESADDVMKMPGCRRFWWVQFGIHSMSFIDEDLEVINENR